MQILIFLCEFEKIPLHSHKSPETHIVVVRAICVHCQHVAHYLMPCRHETSRCVAMTTNVFKGLPELQHIQPLINEATKSWLVIKVVMFISWGYIGKIARFRILSKCVQIIVLYCLIVIVIRWYNYIHWCLLLTNADILHVYFYIKSAKILINKALDMTRSGWSSHFLFPGDRSSP